MPGHASLTTGAVTLSPYADIKPLLWLLHSQCLLCKPQSPISLPPHAELFNILKYRTRTASPHRNVLLNKSLHYWSVREYFFSPYSNDDGLRVLV